MKRQQIATAGMLAGAALMLAGTAMAQEPIVANVPFDFTVGKVDLPAGKYIVRSPDDDPSIVMIQSVDGRHAAFALTTALTEKAGGDARLVFDKRDNRYVLERLVEPEGEGRELTQAHARVNHDVTPLPTTTP